MLSKICKALLAAVALTKVRAKRPEGGPLKPRAVPRHQLQVANLLILNIDHNCNKEDNYKEGWVCESSALIGPVSPPSDIGPLFLCGAIHLPQTCSSTRFFRLFSH